MSLQCLKVMKENAELHPAFYGGYTLVGWSGVRFVLLQPRSWGQTTDGALYPPGLQLW